MGGKKIVTDNFELSGLFDPSNTQSYVSSLPAITLRGNIDKHRGKYCT